MKDDYGCTAQRDRADSRLLEMAALASAGRDRDLLASPFAAEIARLERLQGTKGRASLLRAALGGLVERQRPQIDSQRLPDAMKALIRREFARIEKGLGTAGDDHFDLASHSARCDFRILAFGRLPAGVEHIEVGGVPRRLFWSGGLAQAGRTAALFARAGGWGPFYVAHFTHSIRPHAFLLAYTQDSLTAWHRNVAECLRMNPHIRGLHTSSWWYDPQLARVAPHLVFLREGALAHGAVGLRVGSTDGAQRYAVANSPERRRLYEAGEYVPVSYAMVWTRQALLRWAGDKS